MAVPRYVLWLLLALGCASTSHALDPDKRFHHYVRQTWSIEEGLPQISVGAIAQDGEGYIWAATQAGLARFDGVRFTNFNPENTPELTGMLTQALLTDRQGQLWIGTYKGLARYASRRFTAISPPPGEAAAVDVRDIRETADGRILVATPGGVFEVRADALVPLAGAPEVRALGLLPDGDALWIGTEGGAWRLDASGAQLLPLDDQGHPVTVTRFVRAHGRLWAGSNRGLYVLVENRWRRYEEGGLQSLPIEAMFEDRDGNLWIASTEALLRLRAGRVVERIDGGSAAVQRATRTVFEDREGNLWLGSQWEGLTRLWNGWTRRHSVEEGLHDPLVWSLARDPDGRLWVGGNDGLSVLDQNGFKQVLTGAELPHPNAYTLFPERDGLWIGTRQGLVRWHDDRLSAPEEFAPLANAQINGLLRDDDNRLWIASTIGLFRHVPGELKRFGEAEGLSDPRVRVLQLSRAGRLLLGTQDGLFEVKPGEDRVQRVGVDQGLPPHLDFTAIHQLPGDEMLAGTLSEQLFHFDGVHWLTIGRAHGLPVNSPFFISHDSQGWVWVAGIRGVYRVLLSELQALHRGEKKTLDNAQMLLSERGDQRGSQKGYCCNGAGNAKGFIEDDLLWLPTRGGVVTLGSKDVSMNALPPPVIIERVRHSSTWHQVLDAEDLAIPRGARDLAFEFTALSFPQPTSIGLRYRLRGYDRAWQPLADITRRDASYTNLPPGPYVFEVQGANNALVWNPQPAQLTFTIDPWFHETAWFYALVGLGLVGIGFALHHVRTRQLRQQQQALASLVAARTEDLAAANLQLQEASHTDALTGLRNRRFLQGQLPADLAFYVREMRKPGNEGMVMMLALTDIDHFKPVNDRYGHHGGDLVLQQYARVLERQVRSGDYVVRWGGEEFLLVFRPMPLKEAAKIAERIRRAVAEHHFDPGDGGPLRITSSVGFVEYPLFTEYDGAPNWERMVELADLALYTVKSSGRNGWATFRPTAPMRLDTLIEDLKHDTAATLASGRVVLHRSPPAM